MNVVVGVTGGIAAYKAVGVVRALVLAGHEVHVVPTEAALRFVGLPTWEAISRNPVTTSVFDDVSEVRHVGLGQRADLIVIAPATAAAIAKLANGIADDLLGTTVLASRAPLVIAPAMHTEMWQNPATVANIRTLRERGGTIVGPADGQLTGADSGPGRMSEPDEIVAAALAVASGSSAAGSTAGASSSSTGDLAGRRVLVTAGGTREPIDPVRFVGNRSSGRQGVALALAAAARGADVTLLAANLDVAAPTGVRVVAVGTAEELRRAALAESPDHDVVIMAAAVADYRPVEVATAKIKKDDQGDELALRLSRNPDILRELTAARRAGQTIIGFAAETETNRDAQLALGRAKAERKGVDLLVLNRVGWTEGFAAETNEIIVIDAAGGIVAEATGSKASVADRILDLVS
ncbi:bifunctional phosphopantothenoylcysteine decarboxylase/phosphopantothenate--cysteine ligase CoaBC [Schumannella sp. 10F1B-5-1]|uniref:bifunctional phosphopantothenoylcysteine decarboxylase/phosphopantothenate--cysteine ligase CoaBC n=1 Tax=Schumannella sp. 10F1B-5-1 TaxID=2590780 RepID=UPI00113110C1|nr:bifunctional phosphopantothenoylcysteine decarboxylase/phosphopantothenate--cysteine ligase CoaBC [Schumannella sp. 10F1B-5-1]TPW71028.1 bifunctional phosphopantothenoylcysteine decarboxylase/phosphopantothenate--cysteine ligase CoaBC [Schumannella sp. 10F1B-5-1]